LGLERFEDRVGMKLAGGGGDEDVVDVREITAGGERLPKSGEGEGDGRPMD
jgi:hypothetical protein